MRAQYFDGNTSASRVVTFTIQGAACHLTEGTAPILTLQTSDLIEVPHAAGEDAVLLTTRTNHDIRIQLAKADWALLLLQNPDLAAPHHESFTLHKFLLYGGVTLAIFLALIAIVPVLAALVPDSVQNRLGQSAIADAYADTPACVSPKFDAAVAADLQKLLTANAITRPIQVYLVMDSEINAFALPGRNILVNTGLLHALKGNPDLLLAILAHETAHVELGHNMRGILYALLMDVGSRILFGTDGVSGSVGRLSSFFLSARYSRHDEQQADDMGVRYLETAGYDSALLAQALQRLEDSQKDKKKTKADEMLDTVSAYLSTHPETAARITRIGLPVKPSHAKDRSFVVSGASACPD